MSLPIPKPLRGLTVALALSLPLPASALVVDVNVDLNGFATGTFAQLVFTLIDADDVASDPADNSASITNVATGNVTLAFPASLPGDDVTGSMLTDDLILGDAGASIDSYYFQALSFDSSGSRSIDFRLTLTDERGGGANPDSFAMYLTGLAGPVADADPFLPALYNGDLLTHSFGETGPTGYTRSDASTEAVVTITAVVPEPATLILLGTGLIGLGLGRGLGRGHKLA